MTASGDAAVGQARSRIEFTLNGSRLVLTRDQVDSRLVDAVPGPIRTHSARVNDTWYPVRQAFGLATGLSVLDFTSHTAPLLLGMFLEGDPPRGGIDPGSVGHPVVLAACRPRSTIGSVAWPPALAAASTLGDGRGDSG